MTRHRQLIKATLKTVVPTERTSRCRTDESGGGAVPSSGAPGVWISACSELALTDSAMRTRA